MKTGFGYWRVKGKRLRTITKRHLTGRDERTFDRLTITMDDGSQLVVESSDYEGYASTLKVEVRA